MFKFKNYPCVFHPQRISFATKDTRSIPGIVSFKPGKRLNKESENGILVASFIEKKEILIVNLTMEHHTKKRVAFFLYEPPFRCCRQKRNQAKCLLKKAFGF